MRVFSMYNSVKFNWNGFSMGFYRHSELFNKISIFYKCVHVFVSFSHSLFFLESRKVHVLCTFCMLFDTKIIVLCILKTVLNQEKLFTSTNSVKVKKTTKRIENGAIFFLTSIFFAWTMTLMEILKRKAHCVFLCLCVITSAVNVISLFVL